MKQHTGLISVLDGFTIIWKQTVHNKELSVVSQDFLVETLWHSFFNRLSNQNHMITTTKGAIQK